MLISRVGPYNYVLRCAPPLIVNEAQVEEFLRAFRAAAEAVIQEK